MPKAKGYRMGPQDHYDKDPTIPICESCWVWPDCDDRCIFCGVKLRKALAMLEQVAELDVCGVVPQRARVNDIPHMGILCCLHYPKSVV